DQVLVVRLEIARDHRLIVPLRGHFFRSAPEVFQCFCLIQLPPLGALHHLRSFLGGNLRIVHHRIFSRFSRQCFRSATRLRLRCFAPFPPSRHCLATFAATSQRDQFASERINLS